MTCCKYEKFGLLETIRDIPSAGWYYGNITVAQAERLLKDEPNGAFLVRDSSDSNSITDLYTITFKIHNRFGSVRVDYSKGYFSLSLLDPGLPLFRTMMDLISFCYNCSVVQKHPCVCSLATIKTYTYTSPNRSHERDKCTLCNTCAGRLSTTTSHRINWTVWVCRRDWWTTTYAKTHFTTSSCSRSRKRERQILTNNSNPHPPLTLRVLGQGTPFSSILATHPACNSEHIHTIYLP